MILYRIKRLIKRKLYRLIGIAPTQRRYGSWTDARVNSTGYDSNLIAEKVLSATRKVIAGEFAFERDSVLFAKPEIHPPLIAGLGAARSFTNDIKVVDFGGSMGSLFFQHQRYLSAFGVKNWTVIEQSTFVSLANKLPPVADLSYSQDLASAENSNFLLLSSVLNYLEDYESIFSKCLDLPHLKFVMIDRTAFSHSDSEWIIVQEVPEEIYKASYPCRILSESKVNSILEKRGFRPWMNWKNFDSFEPDYSHKGILFIHESILHSL